MLPLRRACRPIALVYRTFAQTVFPGSGPKRKNSSMINVNSTITCLACGHQATETMPTDACVYVYECKACRVALKPKRGDCCVFCSYGSERCPPLQEALSDEDPEISVVNRQIIPFMEPK